MIKLNHDSRVHDQTSAFCALRSANMLKNCPFQSQGSDSNVEKGRDIGIQVRQVGEAFP